MASIVKGSSDAPCPPISVIICARNEAENLQKFLPAFLTQDYPCYEVIVVDDNSFDESEKIILSFQKKYPILRLLSIKEKTSPGKKAALSYAIQESSFDLLCFSDADCEPSSPHWLSHLQTSFQDSDIRLVLGYGAYRKKAGWLNAWIRFEAFYTAIQYFSFALVGRPYMGVGRNLAYRKDLFNEAHGFSRHAHLASGDDDLFVNQVATAGNTRVCFHPEAHTHSVPLSSFKSYYYQKQRHHGASRHYQRLHQWALGLLASSQMLFYAALLLLLLLQPVWWPILTLIYSVRMGVVVLVCAGVSRKLGERDLLLYLPLLDFGLWLYYCVFAPSLLTDSRIRKWKQFYPTN